MKSLPDLNTNECMVEHTSEAKYEQYSHWLDPRSYTMHWYLYITVMFLEEAIAEDW